MRTVTTERLVLEPIKERYADDLYRLFNDPGVAAAYGGAWTRAQANEYAQLAAKAWRRDGVHKWIAYDAATSELVGRGGLSRMPADASDARVAGALELGWAVRSELWGHGYATEIGRAGLNFAFGDLGAHEVFAFTEAHNERSWKVMERLDMTHLGEMTHDGEHFVLYVKRVP